jgi:hypothetical protein
MRTMQPLLAKYHERKHLMPDDLRGRATHVIEEAAEVQKILCKLLRFGREEWEARWQAELLEELTDLEFVVRRLRIKLNMPVIDWTGWTDKPNGAK